MKHMTSKRNYGFSLIEIMVYLAVTVTLAGALVTVFLSLNTAIARNTTERALTEGVSVGLEQISRAMREADSVNTGLSSLNTPSGALALVNGTTTTRFYLTGDVLMMSVNGTEVGPLTGEAVTVQEMTFFQYIGDETELVRAALTLSAVGKASSSTRTFYTSGVLRGSYE